LVEVIGIPRRGEMQVGIVAGHPMGLDKCCTVVTIKFLKSVKNILADEVTLLNPAHLLVVSTHFHEPAAVVENFDAIAVMQNADFVVHGGNLIAKVDLSGNHVGIFVLLLRHAVAGGEHKQRSEEEEANPARRASGEILGSDHGITDNLS